MNDVLIGTEQGLFLLIDQVPVEILAGHQVCAIAARDKLVVAALGQGGVAISTDSGKHWHETAFPALSIVSVAIDRNGGRIAIGTQPAGILISDDGGASWRQMVDFRLVPGTEHWEIPILDLNKPVTSESAGLGAATWNVVFDNHRPDRIIAGIEVGGLAISDDLGATWHITEVGDTPDPHVIRLHPHDPDLALISTGFSRFTDQVGVFRYSTSAGVYRTVDALKSFARHWTDDPNPQYTRAMTWDPRGDCPVSVCVRSSHVQPSNPHGERRAIVYQSRDNGLTWQPVGDGVHAAFDEEYSAVAPDPLACGDLFVGTEAGKLFHVKTMQGHWQQIADFGVRIMCVVTLIDGEAR